MAFISFDAEVQGAVADNSYDGEWSINIGLTHLGFTLSKRVILGVISIVLSELNGLY